MSAFSISPLFVERLGWILVHSVWQFALIALLAGALVRLLRGNSAALRYGVLVVAMIVSGFVPAVTWVLQPGALDETRARQTVFDGEPGSVAAGSPAVEILPLDGQPLTVTGSNDEGPAVEIAAASIPWETRFATSPATPADLDVESSWSEQAATFLRPWLAWIVAAWSLGALLCSLRPLLGWHTLRRLRRVGVSPVSDDVQAALRRMSDRIGVRRAVRVLHSTLARVPVVVGYARPVILLPVSLVTSIPAAQLETILVHELAHVRRHDFLVNLLQTLVETVFFYHPAIWWLSRRIRAERENCCDDLVVAALGTRVEYGRALLAIEELRGGGTVLALGAADGSLPARVRRIVGLQSDSAGSSPWPALSLVVCGIVIVGAIGAFNWQGLAAVPGDDSPARQPQSASETDLPVSAEPLPLEQAAAKPVDNGASATGDVDDTWPPRDPAAFLKRLYQRDAEFNNRSVRVERRWVEHVDPRAVLAAEQQIREHKGLPQIAPPPDDEIPAAYDQPHRARYLMTVRQIELAFDNAADLETMKHPRYAKPVQAKLWPGLPPIAWNRVMMEGRMWLEQERRLKRNSFEWTCGYGLARVIDTIDSIRVENDRLVIQGRLREFLNYWFTREERAKTGAPKDRFEIELDRDMIVRRAVLEIAAEPVRKSKWIYQADPYRRFVLETSGTVRPPHAPPVAAEGRYQVIVQDPQGIESVLQDETSTFLDLSDTLADEELKRRLAPDRQLAVLADPRGGRQETDPSSDAAPDVARGTGARPGDTDWGKTTNGLRLRVIPVPSSMSEDAIDPARHAAKFAQAEDVAFIVELENVSGHPVQLLDTRYGDGYGDSKGKANSDWYGQFLFAIDLFDGDGKELERPEVEVVDLNHVLDGVLVVSLQPGKIHRYLLRPARWLSPLAFRFEPGAYRAAVRYHGLPARVATRIKKYRPDSPVLAAVTGDVTSAQVAFEVQPASPRVKSASDGGDQQTDDESEPTLVWGEPTDGLRAALEFLPRKVRYAHGEKLETKFHVQNVSGKPITLASHLWISELKAAVKNELGEAVAVGSTWYSGWTLSSRVTLQPRQTVIYDAGNVGPAITAERAKKFPDVTHRTLVAPAGDYTMQLAGRFGDSFVLKDGKGKVLAPLDGDWKGELKTGEAPLKISGEMIECDIVDGVTGKPVAGTTVSFRFLKPKSGDRAEEIVADIFWGPQAPNRVQFYVPDKVLRRADREEIEVQWGLGQHPDYEDYSAEERIPLKPFFQSDSKYLREILKTIKLTPRQKVGVAEPTGPVPPGPVRRDPVRRDPNGVAMPTGMMQRLGRARPPEPGPSRLIYNVLFADPSSLVASTDGEARVWDLKTGQLQQTLAHQNTFPVIGLAFSPDGATIASGHLDSTVSVCNRWHPAIVLRPVARDGRWVHSRRTVRVRVVDAQNATGIKGVVVKAERKEGKPQTDGMKTTDAEGFVEFTGLDAIYYQWGLSAAKPLPYIARSRTSGPNATDVVIKLQKACQLTLRAVDAETGLGIAGVKFGRERALGEYWMRVVVPDTLGANRPVRFKFDSDPNLPPESDYETDADGYYRCLVGPETWSYMVYQLPPGYRSIEPIGGRQEVEIETPSGGKVEFTFRLVR